MFIAINWAENKKIDDMMEKIDNMKINSDTILEAVQALSGSLNSLKSPDIIELDSSVELPTLPLMTVDEVSYFNDRLVDPKFLDQMVRYSIEEIKIYY